MRTPKALRSSFLILSSLVVVAACATGELLDETQGPLGSTGGESGGDGGSGGGSASSGGSTSSGGASSTGGGLASGGVSSNGGSEASGGASQGGGGGMSPEDCEPTEKLCNGACTPPFPGIGCGLSDCTPCSAAKPDHGTLACIGTQCGINCEAGYRVDGDDCVPTGGSGGSGGGSGGAGSGGTSSGGSKSTGGTSSGGSGGGSGGTSTGGSKSTGGSGGATQCVPRNCPDCGPILGPSCCTPQNKCGCPIFYIPGTCG